MKPVRADILMSVKRVIEMLVRREFDELQNMTNGVRLTASEMAAAIDLYGRKLMLPPDDAYSLLDVIEVRASMPKRWSTYMPLWTQEEGRSDLSFELTLIDRGDHLDVELDDIRVP
jgi:hypothetical protein